MEGAEMTIAAINKHFDNIFDLLIKKKHTKDYKCLSEIIEALELNRMFTTIVNDKI